MVQRRWALLLLAFISLQALAQGSPIQTLLATELRLKGVQIDPKNGATAPPAEVRKRAIEDVGPANASEARAVGLIVKFDPSVQALSRQNSAPPAELLRAIQDSSPQLIRFERAMSGGLHLFRFAAPVTGEYARTIAEAIRQLPRIVAVDLDLEVRPLQSGPSDPDAKYEWNMYGPTTGVPGGIDAFSLWPYWYGSGYSVVAVVDTGVRPNPEFSSRLLPGYDFVSSTKNANDGGGRDASADDPGDWTLANECGTGIAATSSSWHGTFVTGIVAADGLNGYGIAGVAWKTRILPVRVLGKCGGSAADIIDGMVWAAGLPVPGVQINPNPAHIINLSLSGASPDGCTWAYQEVVNLISSQGVLVVAAAGNDSGNAAKVVPASCQGVLTVFATNFVGGRASYSNVSLGGGIAAPGGDISRYGPGYGIRSTSDTGTTTSVSATIKEEQGTSFAAPHVSGVAALALSANPNLWGPELAAIMQLTASPFAAGSVCTIGQICGAGIVNAPLSVAAAALMQDRQLIFEFYNSGANHFFRTGNKAEAAVVNRGSAGPGWYDTLNYFYAWREQVAGTQPVCRFYSQKANSHFYTANSDECEGVKKNADWHYEGISFYAKLPVGGLCGDGLRPVYRVYNNRHAFNDQNHRFTTDYAIYEAMVKSGWRAEGVALCV